VELRGERCLLIWSRDDREKGARGLRAWRRYWEEGRYWANEPSEGRREVLEVRGRAGALGQGGRAGNQEILEAVKVRREWACEGWANCSLPGDGGRP